MAFNTYYWLFLPAYCLIYHVPFGGSNQNLLKYHVLQCFRNLARDMLIILTYTSWTYVQETSKQENTMGIFTRFRDIVSSNINAMLDKAEDPEKMIKLMIREMEDTLVELKASCAAVIAESKKMQRRLDEINSRKTLWEKRVGLAVEKGRDDLAREALVEKRRFSQMAQAMDGNLAQQTVLAAQYRDDIAQLEDKLQKAREKQHLLIQRHIRAQRSKQAHQDIRRMDNYETIAKFDELESRIDRMEAEASLVNPGGARSPLEDAFYELDVDEEIEKELSDIKATRGGNKPPSPEQAGPSNE
jgi:phage shock protein A